MHTGQHDPIRALCYLKLPTPTAQLLDDVSCCPETRSGSQLHVFDVVREHPIRLKEMGYTHHWSIPEWHSDAWQSAFSELVSDTHHIIHAACVPLKGPDTMINGVRRMTSPKVSLEEGIHLNGREEYEDFVLSAESNHHTICQHRRLFFAGHEDHPPEATAVTMARDSCETGRRPYDLVVACILLRAYMLAPTCIDVSSNGRWDGDQWKMARNLYLQLWPQDDLRCPWNDGNRLVDDSAELGRQLWMGALSDTANPNQDLLDTLVNQAMAEMQLATSDDRARQPPQALQREDLLPLLAACEYKTAHDACIPRLLDWLPDDTEGHPIRLLDVVRQYILPAPEGVSYVALSYFEGTNFHVQLDSNTAASLMEPFGLCMEASRCPKTVRDAMELCRLLGIRYLWVESLCIMHDDPLDCHVQVARMAAIYAAARYCVVNTCATKSCQGLFDHPRKSSLHRNYDFRHRLQATEWFKLSGKYEAMVLRNRCLLFTSFGLFLKCQGGTFNHTGKIASTEIYDVMTSFIYPESRMPTSRLEDLFSAVREYTGMYKHSASFDMERTVWGDICKAYEHDTDDQLLGGLPRSAFDQALCWMATKPMMDRRDRKYPSWSWLGWCSTVDVPAKASRNRISNHTISQRAVWGADQIELYVRKSASSVDGSDPCSPLAFGFPTYAGAVKYPELTLHLYGSVAVLRIAAETCKDDEDNGTYQVFPSWCTWHVPQHNEVKPGNGDSTADDEFAATSILEDLVALDTSVSDNSNSIVDRPTPTEAEDKDELTACIDCFVGPALGKIRLDPQWRGNQDELLCMSFLALDGDYSFTTGWHIRKLMLLDVQEDTKILSCERLQVMDSDIVLEDWLNTGASVREIYLS